MSRRMVPGEPASSSRMSMHFECIMVAVGVGALFTWIASGGPLGGKEVGNEYRWIKEEGSETGQHTKIVKIHRRNVPQQRRKVHVEQSSIFIVNRLGIKHKLGTCIFTETKYYDYGSLSFVDQSSCPSSSLPSPSVASLPKSNISSIQELSVPLA